MDIFCACPFAVALQGWDPAPGRRSLSVCVKATFVLVPGAVSILAPLQEPVRFDEPSGTAAPELVPFKPRADILVTGHAHAPGGAPTDSLIARARIGPFRKSLSINGDRTWVPSFDGLRPSVAVPFRRMPLSYDRAVRTGENLTGVDISQGAELNRPLANIAAIADQGGETPGLSPIPLAWRAHRLALGDASLLWASRAGLVPGPPPPGFDFRVFNAAPSEQQVDEIPPGADVLLENLHPDHPRLETRLPFFRVKLFRRPPRGDASVEIPTRWDTLWIDADRGLAIALWRGAVLVDGGDDASVGLLVVTAELDGERVVPADVDRMLARIAPDVTYVDAGALREGPGGYPHVPEPIPVPERPPSFPSAPPLSPAAFDPGRPASAPPAPAALPPPPALPFHGVVAGGPAPRAPAAPSRAEGSYPPPPPRLQPDEVGDEEVESLDAPTPAPRGPITLVPPPVEPSTVSTISALPFRPTGEGASPSSPPRSTPPVAAALPSAWAPVDDDTEVTPPRGYPALSDLRAPSVGRFGTMPPEPAPSATPALPPPPLSPSAPPPAEPAADPQADLYCAIRMEHWQSEAPLREVLARRGIDEASFRAHEAAQVEALEREATEGRSEHSIALLEGLSAAERGG